MIKNDTYDIGLLNEISEGNNIFFCSSKYHVLVALIIIITLGNYDNNCIVIIPPAKPMDDYHDYIPVFKRISDHGIKCYLVDKMEKIYRLFGISIIKNNYVFRTIRKEFTKPDNREYRLVNFAWNKFYVTYPACIYYKHCKEAVFIEEGMTQYAPKENFFYFNLLRLYGNHANWWKEDKVKGIYVHFPQFFPDYLQKLIRTYTLNSMVNKWNETIKKEFQSIYLNRNEEEELENLKKGDGIVIFTTMFDWIYSVKDDEKVAIYKRIAEFYSQYGKVFLKRHPRDHIEYSGICAHVIEASYPSEIWTLLGIKFKLAIGLATSAVESVLAERRIDLNPDFLTQHTYNLIPLEEVPLCEAGPEMI